MPGDRLEELGRILGHDFRDWDVLREALTHPSVGKSAADAVGNYERLEFLGDRVLGMIAAEKLLRLFPNAPAGELARRYNALVRRESLARVAQEIGLGRFILMSRSETTTGGREKPALLADACEAVIAALFLDGGVEAARQFIDRHWRALLREESAAEKDAKTALQEWAHKATWGVPRYDVVDRQGPPHAPVFTVEVTLTDSQLEPRSATGQGVSKRAAEQAAAGALLAVLARPARGRKGRRG